MVDPVAPQAQIIAQQAQSAGLANLMKGGSLTGTVLSQQQGGKTTVSFQGHSFTFNLKGGTLVAGQQVQARMVGGRVVLQPIAQPASGQADVASTAAARSLGTVLASMGFTSQSSQAIAQALVGAGIPLDNDVLKQLAQILPDASSQQIPALSFLFSRGLPVNSAIASLISQLFSPKTKQETSVDKVLSSLKELDESEDGKDPVLPPDRRSQLRDLRQQLEGFIMPLRHQGGKDYEEQLEAFFRAALASPEALILGNDGENSKAFAEAIVRLLALLLDLQPLLEGTKHQALLETLLTSVKELHETLSARALQNLPPQTLDSNHPVYFQIPFNDRDRTRHLEVKYRSKGKDRKSGHLDLRLELTQFGPTLISIHWEHPQLSVTIWVQNEETAKFAEPMLGELKDVLEEKGFRPVSVGITTGEIPDTIEPQDDSHENIARSGLDLRA